MGSNYANYDLVQRLRVSAGTAPHWLRNVYREAADEIERLRADRDSWMEQAHDRINDWDDMRQRAEKAERELAELRERFEKAPAAMLSEGPGGRGYVKAHLSRHATIEPPIGQRVRLVRED